MVAKMVERTCIVTRQTLETSQLVRFVLDPENNVVGDLKGKLPGRGVWVTANKDLVGQAVDKKLFARGFKTKCTADVDLAEKLEKQFETRCLNAFSMAKKTGAVITGFDKVSTALNKNNVTLLLQASDGAKDGQEKLERKFLHLGPADHVIKVFSCEQMSMAFGGTNVIHAAITQTTMAKNILAHVAKLLEYRSK